MLLKRSLFLTHLVALFLLILGCGADTNFNKTFFVGANDEARVDSLLAKSRILYDQGKTDEALKLAEKAQDINPNSEKGAQLLGFIYLAKAGVDTFSLINKLLANKVATTVAGSSSNPLDILSTLAGLFNITAADYGKMGTLDGLDTDTSLKDYFSAYPVYLPKNPGNHSEADTPRHEVATLNYLSKAIAAICPLIAASITDSAYVSSGDDRYNCSKSDAAVDKPGQTYFLFALAHLVETVIYNSILLYSSSSAQLTADASSNAGGAGTNLMKRVLVLQGLSTSSNISLSEIAKFTSAIVKLKTTVDAVFNLSDQKSMLAQTMSNLNLMIDAFGQISGVDSVVSSLKAAMNQITAQAEKIQSTVSGVNATNQAFAQQLNSSISKNLNATVSSYLDAIDAKLKASGSSLKDKIDQDETTKADIKAVCDSMAALVSVADSLSVPSKCSLVST